MNINIDMNINTHIQIHLNMCTCIHVCIYIYTYVCYMVNNTHVAFWAWIHHGTHTHFPFRLSDFPTFVPTWPFFNHHASWICHHRFLCGWSHRSVTVSSQVLLKLYYLIAEILAYSVEYLVPFLRRLTSVGILSLGHGRFFDIAPINWWSSYRGKIIAPKIKNGGCRKSPGCLPEGHPIVVTWSLVDSFEML